MLTSHRWGCSAGRVSVPWCEAQVCSHPGIHAPGSHYKRKGKFPVAGAATGTPVKSMLGMGKVLVDGLNGCAWPSLNVFMPYAGRAYGTSSWKAGHVCRNTADSLETMSALVCLTDVAQGLSDRRPRLPATVFGWALHTLHLVPLRCLKESHSNLPINACAGWADWGPCSGHPAAAGDEPSSGFN